MSPLGLLSEPVHHLAIRPPVPSLAPLLSSAVCVGLGPLSLHPGPPLHIPLRSCFLRCSRGMEIGGRVGHLDPIVGSGLSTSQSQPLVQPPPSCLPGTAVAQHLVSVYPGSGSPEHSAFLVAGRVWNLLLPPSCLGSTLPLPMFTPCPAALSPPLPPT